MTLAASPFNMVLKLALKWWWLIAISVALGAGVGFFVRSRQPDVYYAKVSILFDQNFQSQRGDVQMAAVQDTMDIYAGLARRANVLQPVIEELNLKITIDALNARMAVFPTPNLPLLEITVADTNASAAANIANRVAQELINKSSNLSKSQDIEFRRLQLARIQDQIENLQTRLTELGAESANLTSAFDLQQNSQARAETSRALLEQQQLYASMSTGVDTTQSTLLTIYEPATAETAGVVRGSLASVVLSGIAGLVLSLGTIVLLGYFDDRLQWNEHVQHIKGVRVLGPLGLIPRGKLPLYTVTMPEAIESEVLRQLRAKITLAAGGVPPRILTVTSYDSGDGKTTTSANLAMISAQNGFRTLLIDGDIRKGDSHEIFNLPNVMGLSDILASRKPIPELISQALLDSGYENLTVLTSGRSTADPASLLGGQRLEQLLGLLQDRFDAIVMDSVPTIGGPDAAFMAEASDGVLIVVHAQRTTQRALERTLENLQQGRNINILGMAFNRIPLQIVSTYNQPYYRRSLAISNERLNKEISAADKKQGLLPRFNPQVIKGEDGELRYSFAAASVQLGVKEKTLREWVGHGLLKVENINRKEWLKQSEIQHLLDNLPRHQAEAFPEMALPIPPRELLLQQQSSLTRDVLAMASPAPENGENGNGRYGNGYDSEYESGAHSTTPTPAITLPDMLRGQREAILEFLRAPLEPEDDRN